MNDTLYFTDGRARCGCTILHNGGHQVHVLLCDEHQIGERIWQIMERKIDLKAESREE